MPSRSIRRAPHKYLRVERERRFLLDHFPAEAIGTRFRRITDRYIEGARLRLRHQCDEEGSSTLKLTQKIPAPGSGARQGFITTMYLSEKEFEILAALPAKQLKKTRYSAPPFGIDVFEDRLKGLILADAEFDSASGAESLELPLFAAHEVTEDARFTGGWLARSSRSEVEAWLSEYGVGFPARSRMP